MEHQHWNHFQAPPIALPEPPLEILSRSAFESFSFTGPLERTWSQLPTPQFRLEKDHVVGIRPFRKTGFRLERENLGRKILLHNYGHGGAGVTLSWGAAELTADLIRDRVPQKAAVLGGGIIGLSTAAVLLERGFEVTLYAEKLHPHVVSSIAGGQFAPSAVEAPAHIAINEVLLRSWRRFEPLIKAKIGVSYAPNFFQSSGGAFNSFPPNTIPGGQVYSLDRLPFEGKPRKGSYVWTLLIEPPRYLTWLEEKIRQQGAIFQSRSFHSTEELLNLPEDIVVNCLGMGAKRLFNDPQLTGIRGELILLHPQEGLDYLLSFTGGYIFGRSDAVVLGGTFDFGREVAAKTAAARRQILARCREFFA